MKLKMKILALFIICAMSSLNVQSQQDGFLGEVKIFAGNFAPRSWAFCEGQILSISQNTALFAILGTTYGGDGRTTFALPDLRSRGAGGQGRGPGLLDYKLGQKGGAQNNTLTVSNTGGNQAINKIQPYLSINYIICINGTFPSRN
jgi:microcystin-dependent protein